MNIYTDPERHLETMHVEVVSDAETRLHFSERAADIIDAAKPYGNAYLQSLGSLGMTYEVDGQVITIAGSSTDVVNAAPAFARNRDTLAQTSSLQGHEFQQDSYRRIISGLLGFVAEKTLSNIGTDMAFHNTVASLTTPHVDNLLTTGGVRIVPGKPDAPPEAGMATPAWHLASLHRRRRANVLGVTS